MRYDFTLIRVDIQRVMKMMKCYVEVCTGANDKNS